MGPGAFVGAGSNRLISKRKRFWHRNRCPPPYAGTTGVLFVNEMEDLMTSLSRILMALVLVAFAGGTASSVYAQGSGTDADKVDCKKTPNHPKCKAGEEGGRGN